MWFKVKLSTSDCRDKARVMHACQNDSSGLRTGLRQYHFCVMGATSVPASTAESVQSKPVQPPSTSGIASSAGYQRAADHHC